MSFSLNFGGFRCSLLKKIFNSLSMVICFAFSLGTFGHFKNSINSGGKLDLIFLYFTFQPVLSTSLSLISSGS